MKTEKELMEQCLIKCVKDAQEDVIIHDAYKADITNLITKVLDKCNIDNNSDNFNKISEKIVDMYNVHEFKIIERNCEELALYSLLICDEVDKLTMKYKSNEYNYRSFVTMCLLYIIHNLKMGIHTIIYVKEAFNEIFKENGGIIWKA